MTVKYSDLLLNNIKANVNFQQFVNYTYTAFLRLVEDVMENMYSPVSMCSPKKSYFNQIHTVCAFSKQVFIFTLLAPCTTIRRNLNTIISGAILVS